MGFAQCLRKEAARRRYAWRQQRRAQQLCMLRTACVPPGGVVGEEALRLAPPGAGVLVEVLQALATREKSTSTSGKSSGVRVAVRSVLEDHETAILEVERHVELLIKRVRVFDTFAVVVDTVQTRRNLWRSHRYSSGMVVDALVVVQRQVPWLGRAENCGVSAVAVLVGVVQFLDKVVVAVGATTVGCAMLGSTMDTCYASSRVAVGRVVYDFLHEGVDSAPELDSRPAAHCRPRQWHVPCWVLLVLTSRCVPMIAGSLGNLYIFSTGLLYYQHVQRSNFLRESIFLEPSSTHTCECSRAGGCWSRRDSQVIRYRYCTINPRRL